MPITFTLEKSGRIAHVVVMDPWGLQDLTALHRERKAFLDGIDYKAHLLIDLCNARTIPVGTIFFTSVEDRLLLHPNAGYVAVVGASHVIRRVAETVCHILHFESVRYFDVEAEARAYLRALLDCEAAETQIALN